MENSEQQQANIRSSRASSTSSLGREVRCACQYFRSDSLLPERSALAAQLPQKARSPQAMTPPAARRLQQPQQRRNFTSREAPAVDHHHQQKFPPATEADHHAMVQAKKYYRGGSERSRKAPVVQISDTDRVDDSSDSLELDRKRTRELVAEDVYIPCDGQVEDVLMDAERMGEQTSDNTVDEDAVLRQAQELGGAKGFFKNQAGKIKTHFKGMHRPSFSLPRRKKIEKQSQPTTELTTEEKPVSLSQPSSPKMEKASRMERFRMALPERIPKPKFNLPDRSKFHMKKPNIHLPASLSRSRKTVHSEHFDQENVPPILPGDEKPSRSIFDFATFPRPKKLFEKRKQQQQANSDASYVTSTPKDERSSTVSTEDQLTANGNTLPRVKKKSSFSLSARWAQRFGETAKDPRGEDEHVLERTTPWGHPSLEKPRLSLKPEGSEENLEKLPWEQQQQQQNTSERIYDLDVDEPKPELEITTENIKMEVVVKDAGSETVVDPKLRDDEELQRIEARDEMKKLMERTVYIIDAEEKKPGELRRDEDEEEEEEEIDFDKFFPPVDPIDFERGRPRSPELSDDDESMRSDKEIQQSSGSSCERRRRGDVGEEPKDRHQHGFKFISDIKEALRSRKSPHRNKGTKEERRSLPPKKPARSPGSIQNIKTSQETHRIVYQAETPYQDQRMEEEEPLDDIVVVKPVRRKSRSSLSRVSGTEDNILLTPIDQRKAPPVPCRRKRLRREQSSSLSIKTFDSATYNGFVDARTSQASSPERLPLPNTPASTRRFRDDEHDRPPIPPKRRSHSRGTSLIPDDDRTSRGAESLPELAFEDDALTPRSSSGEPSLPGYAVIEKKDRPPRLPPPRRKSRASSGRFATVPRRPKPAISPSRVSLDSVPFADDDDVTAPSHRYLVDGEVVNKMRDRPLPAPPRPPRSKRDRKLRLLRREITPDQLSEAAASTQTDPLPDDLAIEDLMEEDDGATEITTAKLTVTPTRSGSLVKISTERIPSPTNNNSSTTTTPPAIPPLPSKQRDFERRNLEHQNKDNTTNQPMMPSSEQLSMLRSALLSTEEPLKIQSLEVSDLKVDRLTVSQLEAYKVTASEIEAIVVQASELSNNKGDTVDSSSLHPSLLQELIAIRNHLETVAAHSRPASVMEDACTGTSDERIIDNDGHSLENERNLLERASATRETSPFLQIQPSTAEKDATSEMGRTMLPSSASNPDLTRIPDQMVVTKEPIDKPIIIIDERDNNNRSRSVSPSRGGGGIPGGVIVRQTASPVKSLPPVISDQDH